MWAALWALIFIAGGIGFLVVFLRNTEQWWALIPGFTLLGIGVGIGLSQLGIQIAENLIAPVILGSISVAFLAVYLVRREQWWALIPGGVMASIALMVLLSEYGLDDTAMVSVMFFGMAATFLIVAIVPTPHGRMTWGFIPAAVLFLIGLLMLGSLPNLINYVWPLALVIGGGILLYRALATR